MGRGQEEKERTQIKKWKRDMEMDSKFNTLWLT
jgi:hypothetical protein